MSFQAENQSEPDLDAPVPCDNVNCSFWGRPSTGNLCSQCYKEKLKEQEEDKEKMSQTSRSKSVASTTARQPAPLPVLEEDEDEIVNEKVEESGLDEGEKEIKELLKESASEKLVLPMKRVQKDTRRCMECNKFMGFTGIKCKCGFVFCGKHRYPEEHECEFDFDQQAKERYSKGKFQAAVADKISGEKL